MPPDRESRGSMGDSASTIWSASALRSRAAWRNRISGTGRSKRHVEWIRELAGVYLGWAKRRGYTAKVLGENHGAGEGSCAVLLLIGGMNAFGLLRNEEGVHRKRVEEKKSLARFDCTVAVIPDVQEERERGADIRLNVKKLSPARRGWRIRSLSRRVTLDSAHGETRLVFLSDTGLAGNRKLAIEFFLSFLHHEKDARGARKKPAAGVWGSIVRTMTIGSKSSVVDHATRISLRNVKSYLSGKIDTLLLERIL